MRRKIPAAVTVALALLIPAAPAAAQAVPLKPTAVSCPAVIEYTDIRTLVTIDLDTAAKLDLQLLSYRILEAARANALGTVIGALDAKIGSATEELRAFLKGSLQPAWKADLRRAAYRTLEGKPGPHLAAAGNAALTTGTHDALLSYLNHGQYIARASDAGSVKLYTDIRTLITIDLDTASDGELQVLSARIREVARAEALGTVTGALAANAGGTTEELRAFLKGSLQPAWKADLRRAAYGTLGNPGPQVAAAGNAALTTGSHDALLSYLNHGLYVARAADCVI